jgi:hypothetical protein
VDPDDGERLLAWLRERGIEDERRVVRASPSGILVSKFPAGFAARLHDSVGRLGALFDDDAVGDATKAIGTSDPSVSRVAAWHGAVLGVLRVAEDAGIVTPSERAEVEAGVDSVAALLDTALWTGPTWSDDAWTPGEGEVTAFREALSRMHDADGLFSRHYGVFDGAPVTNHCPGVGVARRLLEQAWSVCTGTNVPSIAGDGGC